MKEELLHIGPVTIYGYGLMIAIGVVACYLVMEYRARKLGMKEEKVLGLVFSCVLGGFLGAKVLYFITEFSDIVKNPSLLLNLSDGFVVYGGILGGIFVGYLYCRFQKLKFLEYFDLAMPSVALAQGVWKNRLFSGGMLLWSGDGRRVRHYVSQFQLCPQRSSSLSYAAGIQRLRLSSLRNSALGFRKEKGRRTGSGLLFDFL